MSGHKPWSVIREKLRADAGRRGRIERREKAIAESLRINRVSKACDASQLKLGSRRKSPSSEGIMKRWKMSR